MGNPPFYDNLFTIDNSALLAAAQGGAIIAVAATIYYALFGSILGMSGLTGSLVKFPTSTYALTKDTPPNLKPLSYLASS
jgi:hypothetical protein